jgi:hypothetical protein
MQRIIATYSRRVLRASHGNREKYSNASPALGKGGMKGACLPQSVLAMDFPWPGHGAIAMLLSSRLCVPSGATKTCKATHAGAQQEH